MLDQTHTALSAPQPYRRPVGITKGPGETTHEYTFVSRDDEQVLKNEWESTLEAPHTLIVEGQKP